MPSCCHFCRSDDFFEKTQWILGCRCNEDPDAVIEWHWSDSDDVQICEDSKSVVFHPLSSQGTSVVRGAKILDLGLHYWEVKVLSPVYGTDIMVGVGRPQIDTRQYLNRFLSALGHDCQSWGFSYRGEIQHAGETQSIRGSGFTRGDIVGCLLDLWHGNLSFYVNRKPIASKQFTHIPIGTYYPMLSSTAARSGFRLIYAKSYPITLQLLACLSLQGSLTNPSSIFDLPGFPKGLQTLLMNNLPWLFFNSISSVRQKKDNAEELLEFNENASSITDLSSGYVECLTSLRNLYQESSFVCSSSRLTSQANSSVDAFDTTNFNSLSDNNDLTSLSTSSVYPSTYSTNASFTTSSRFPSTWDKSCDNSSTTSCNLNMNTSISAWRILDNLLRLGSTNSNTVNPSTSTSVSLAPTSTSESCLPTSTSFPSSIVIKSTFSSAIHAGDSSQFEPSSPNHAKIFRLEEDSPCPPSPP